MDKRKKKVKVVRDYPTETPTKRLYKLWLGKAQYARLQIIAKKSEGMHPEETVSSLIRTAIDETYPTV